MPKVLIIGPRYFNFISACKSGFLKHGWEVETEEYDNPVHPFRGIWKWRHKIAHNKEIVRQQNRVSYQPYIKSRFDDVSPDYVFLLNADMLLSDTLDYFRKNSKVGIWMFDSVMTVKVSQTHIDHCDAFFCYDLEDVRWYQSKGKKVYFLPQACDFGVYHPIPNRDKDIDILFVGNIYTSEKRKMLLNLVADNFSDKKVLFFGLYKPFVKNPIACIFRNRRNIFMNKNIDSTLANDYYNRTKVALNIHSEQQKDGANPRLFEIAGTKTYQICDANPYIENLFRNEEIGLYHNNGELISLIKKALDNDMGEKAESAYRMVLEEHSFDKRMEVVINTLSAL